MDFSNNKAAKFFYPTISNLNIRRTKFNSYTPIFKVIN